MIQDTSFWRGAVSRWPRIDLLIFVLLFAYLSYGLASGLGQYLWETVQGKGFISDLTGPVAEQHYYKIILAIIWLLIPLLTLWEIVTFLAAAFAAEKSTGRDIGSAARILGRLRTEYKPTYSAALLGDLLTRFIIIDVFWLLLPVFQKLSLFTVKFTWYGWLYALLAWELSTWVWHVALHKVRLLWCLHSPHHAAQQFNMTVAWVHFFAEGYVTAVIQLVILMILGVPPAMLVIIMAFEVGWGTFIHAGERAFKTGRLGWLRYFLITPSYHRVHHGKNPLYMDTNFCTMLPFWDWLFGTLQPLRDEVKLEYGITRPMDATHFIDFYFGDFILLYQDVAAARGWRNKLRYLWKPPGWTPESNEHTAGCMKQAFREHHPDLGLSSKRQLLRRRLPAFITLVWLATFAQTVRAENLGEVRSFQKTAHGIEGRTDSVRFSVDVYSAHVVRVRVARLDTPQHEGYALADNALPDFRDFSVKTMDRGVVLATAAVVTAVETRPQLRVIFKDIDGRVLNEDMAGQELGMTLLGQKMTVYKTLQPGERFLGMGEQLGNLDRRGSVVTLRNTDNYKYDDPKVPMYVSIPFFTGLHGQKVYGLFFNNSFRSVFNFGASNKRFASYSFDGGGMDEFFIHDDSVRQVLEHYTQLTGRMPLPPKWSLGYQQSRCSYYPADQVMFIARTFRDKHLPLDGIVLDADYLHQYQPFRINTQRFPDMKKLAGALRGMNIELTASVNPGIAIDDTYAQYKTGLQQDVFLKFADGELFTADIAPNTNHFTDYSSAKGRSWWIDNMKVYQDLGINGYWNDMNEPAIDGQAMPDNVVFDFDGQKTTPLEAQNYYGMLMARASFESFQKYGGNKRPFVLSRAGFAGIQRYAAVWSGDNQAKDEHILLGVLLNNQMGLSGVPFTGPDLGGYIGDGNKDLYRRWIEVGVFSPYLRNHREQFAAANEPWAYGEEAEAISKAYLEFRYRLMPYLYSIFYEATGTGMPISRSLGIDYSFDDNVYKPEFQYEFLFGPGLLLNPMTSKERSKTTYLPAGNWYDLFTDQRYEGGRSVTAEYPGYKIPTFAKASSIIPMHDKVESTNDDPGNTLYIHLFNGAEASEFVYYDDDGRTLNYLRGKFLKRSITFDPSSNRLRFSRPEGSFASPFKTIKVIFHGFDSIRSATVNGTPVTPATESIRMLDPLDSLSDVYYDKTYFQRLRDSEVMRSQSTLTFVNTPEILVKW